MKSGADRWFLAFSAFVFSLSSAQTTANSASSITATAQTSNASSTATSSAAAQTHTVAVGSGGFMYSPNVTHANAGDTVLFQFYPTNHSVIRSEYTNWEGCGAAGCNPCVPYQLYHPGSEGFFSGNMEVSEFGNNPPSWSLLINDTDPIWFYCDALESCHPNGMVGVINPPNDTALDAQKAAAVAAHYQLGPNQTWPVEGGGAASSSASSTSTSTSTPTSSAHHSSGLSSGAIAGIAVGVAVVVIALAAALFFFVGRNRAYSKFFKHSQATDTATNPPPASEAGTLQGTPALGATGAWVEKQRQDLRYSNSTAFTGVMPPHSPGPEEGRFVGYNKQTGSPEFAAEAPMDTQVQEMAVPGQAMNVHPVELDSNELQPAQVYDGSKK